MFTWLGWFVCVCLSVCLSVGPSVHSVCLCTCVKELHSVWCHSIYNNYYTKCYIIYKFFRIQLYFRLSAKLQGLAEQYEEREKVNCNISIYGNYGNLIEGLNCTITSKRDFIIMSHRKLSIHHNPLLFVMGTKVVHQFSMQNNFCNTG